MKPLAVQKQEHLETLYNKFQQIPFLTKLFEEANIAPADDPATPHVIRLLVHLAIQKRLQVGAAIGILASKISLEDAVTVIEACVEAGIVAHDPKKNELIVVLEPDKATQEKMKHYMFPPPMVCKPKTVKHNGQSGYLLIDTSVMTKKSHTNEDVCLDVINILNSFRYKLNLDILKYSSKYKSLSKMKEGETTVEYNKRLKQWKNFDSETRELIKNHYSDEDTIWFTHCYDKRGRIYCRGYHFNYQGCEWRKALIQFEPEVLQE